MKERKPFALLMNDLHISKDNIAEFKKNWQEAIRVCEQRDINKIIIGGDLWQSRSAQTLDVLLAVAECLYHAELAEIGVWIANGNHCKVDLEAEKGYSDLYASHSNVMLINTYARFEMASGYILWVMAYFPEKTKAPEFVKEITEKLLDDQYNVFYCHQGIRGGLQTASDDEMPTSLFDKFDKVLVGHYHDRKKVSGTNIQYIGASRQHNYGEDPIKGYTVIYNDGTDEFIQNTINRTFTTVTVRPEDLTEERIASISALASDNNTSVKVKIICQGEECRNVDKQLLIELGVNKVEIVTETVEESESQSQKDITQRIDKEGIKEEYRSFCDNKGINAGLGIHYLDQIK